MEACCWQGDHWRSHHATADQHLQKPAEPGWAKQVRTHAVPSTCCEVSGSCTCCVSCNSTGNIALLSRRGWRFTPARPCAAATQLSVATALMRWQYAMRGRLCKRLFQPISRRSRSSACLFVLILNSVLCFYISCALPCPGQLSCCARCDPRSAIPLGSENEDAECTSQAQLPSPLCHAFQAGVGERLTSTVNFQVADFLPNRLG